MSRQNLVWLLVTLLLTTAPLADAQQPKKVPRIGFLAGIGNPSNPGPNVAGFRQGPLG